MIALLSSFRERWQSVHILVSLRPGMCAGFKAGSGDAHHLINRTGHNVTYLEIGDRNPGDTVIYPDDDIGRALTPDGQRIFVHTDGRPY